MSLPTFRVVGFTGTQRGCTRPHQFAALADVLTDLRTLHGAEQLHHGDCVGADDQAHQIATRLGYWIAVHPPVQQSKAVGYMGNVRYPPKDFLRRDDDIAGLCDVLVACPGEFEEQRRSGTWATVRYARRRLRPVVFVYPDGSVHWEYPQVLEAVE